MSLNDAPIEGRWISLEDALVRYTEDEDEKGSEWWTRTLNRRAVEVKQFVKGAPRNKPVWRFPGGDMYLGAWKQKGGAGAGADGREESGFGVTYFNNPARLRGLVCVGNYEDGCIEGLAKCTWVESCKVWKNNYFPHSQIREQIGSRKVSRPFCYKGMFTESKECGDNAFVTLKDGRLGCGKWANGHPVDKNNRRCDWLKKHYIRPDNVISISSDGSDDNGVSVDDHQRQQQSTKRRKKEGPHTSAVARGSTNFRAERVLVPRPRAEYEHLAGRYLRSTSARVPPQTQTERQLRSANARPRGRPHQRPIPSRQQRKPSSTSRFIFTAINRPKIEPMERGRLEIENGVIENQEEAGVATGTNDGDHEKGQLIDDLRIWLTSDLLKHFKCLPDELDKYAQELHNMGVTCPVESVAVYLSSEDIDSFTWMKKLHKRAFMKWLDSKKGA